MLQAFNTLVKPHVDHLNELLGVDHTEDWTVIPVKVKFKSGTTQIFEDGLMMECDHAGADMGDVDLSSLYYNPNTGTVEEFDNTHRGLVCDKCSAWQDEGGDWHE